MNEDLQKDLDIARDLVGWTKTKAGSDTILKLNLEVRKGLNNLFKIAEEKPELGSLLSGIMNVKSSIQMLKRFASAEEDYDYLSSIIKIEEK